MEGNDYDSRENLAVEHSKADHILIRYGSIENIPLSERKTSVRKSLKDILKHTPTQIKNHPHVNALMRLELSNLKKVGYDVNMGYFSEQDKVGKWNYYLKILGDNGFFNKETI